MSLTKREKMILAIVAIVFVAYITVVFVLTGFSGHTATFWLSWGFMVTGFTGMIISVALLGKQGRFLRDWLFGFPIIKHSTLYMIVEFVASTLFIIFEKKVPWQWAFVPQFLFFCAYLVCVISCFIAKDQIKEIKSDNKAKSTFKKLLLSEVQLIAAKCEDEETGKRCAELAEKVRLSDVKSSPLLSDLEAQISGTVTECREYIESGDYENAGKTLKKASDLLDERNSKCMALK